MPRYRKKPVVIEAFRMGPDPLPDWFLDLMRDNTAVIYPTNGVEAEKGPFTERKVYCEINTLEGTMTGNYGDYIIRGVDGEVYPCKPEIFEQTYEKVED